jgi:hypothetical protein
MNNICSRVSVMASIDRLPSGKFRAQIRRRGLATERKIFASEHEALAWATSREASLLTAHNQSVPQLVQACTLRNTVNLYFNSPVYRDKSENTRRRERTAATPHSENTG